MALWKEMAQPCLSKKEIRPSLPPPLPNTNLNYQKVAMVGDQKWKIVEITTRTIFLFEICVHYFFYSKFSSPIWKKSPYLTCQFWPKI